MKYLTIAFLVSKVIIYSVYTFVHVLDAFTIDGNIVWTTFYIENLLLIVYRCLVYLSSREFCCYHFVLNHRLWHRHMDVVHGKLDIFDE